MLMALVMAHPNFGRDEIKVSVVISRHAKAVYVPTPEGIKPYRSQYTKTTTLKAIEFSDEIITDSRTLYPLFSEDCASRLDARLNDMGEAILYDDQDRSRRNAELIDLV
jgi:hypothetical protein